MITTVFYRGLFSKLMHCCLACPSQENISILSIICLNKAHGYDGISVSMLKVCAVEAAIPLKVIF